MSTSKEFPPLKKCDVVEPPLKKCCFGESENSKVTVSSDEISKVTVSSEHLDAISLLSNNGDFVEDEKELPGLNRFDFVKPPLMKSRFGESENSKVTVFSEDLDLGENSEDAELPEHLDVISLLSNNGKTNYLVRSNGEFVDLNIVRGKHLIICAVSLPYTCFDKCVPFWRSVTETYPELSQAGFEMVVSVTVKPNKKEKIRFDNFISKLPCLYIPYTDLDTRNSVCSFINTKEESSCDYGNSVIMVDPVGLILSYHVVSMIFFKYGCEWFTRKVDDIEAEDDVLKIRLDPFYKKTWEQGYLDDWPDSINRDILDQPLSLHQDFLLCDPSRVLSRFDNQSWPVSELSKKHVALYLCLNGNFMKPLNEAYKQCLENNQELEVVLVCMPYFEEPNLYDDKVTELLKRYDIKSWFIFPFDHKVCFRLRRAFCTQWDVEKVIILPPNCKSSGDLEGRAVIQRIGINTYPFTRNAVLEQRFNSLKSVNSASLFQGSSEKCSCLVRNGSKSNVPHSEIKGKKLILYLDWVDLSTDEGQICRLLMKLYPKFLAIGCEVVFVPLDQELGRPHHVDLTNMPWPIMPVEAAIKALVTDNFMLRGEGYDGNLLVVFGEDGKILSRRIKSEVMLHGITEMIFGDYVREEISMHLDLLEERDIDFNYQLRL